MHWRHVSITTTPCCGSRLVALRARVVLAERIGAQPLSQCAGPGQPGGMACRGWPAGCMLGDGARDSASFDPQHAGAPFCDVICIWSIMLYNTCMKYRKGTSILQVPEFGTSKHYGKAHGSLLSGWMICSLHHISLATSHPALLIVDDNSVKGGLKVIDCIVLSAKYWCRNGNNM